MPLRIAIVGGGIGGLSAAIALARYGFDIRVYEQAAQFTRIGSDINLTPNAVRALDGLGIGPALRECAARPTHRISRTWDSGEETSRLPMSDEAERKYGSPQLTFHRSDLLDVLEGAVPPACVALGKKLRTLVTTEAGATLHFADGSEETADLVIGADGIHSVVRATLFGADKPRFTGVVAFRTVVPADRLDGQPNIQAFTKWWGSNPQNQIVTFPLSRGKDIFIFATIGQDSWLHESWTMPGSVDEFRSLYADFHPEARRLLDACDSVLKTALYERDPMPRWSEGKVTLMGDACHPMLPFMAQGACQAVEDAVVLARCLGESGKPPEEAFKLYESLRLERTAKIQLMSRGNEWLKQGGSPDSADWLYGYDVWSVPVKG
jgi:salicylate hydroxylase